MDEREAANRTVAEHVARLRQRLTEGQAEIERQHASLAETREHLESIERWRRASSSADDRD